MGQGVFEVFQGTIIDALEEAKVKKNSPSQSGHSPCEQAPEDSDDDPPTSSGATPLEEEHRGKLILDATVAPQAIRYPTRPESAE